MGFLCGEDFKLKNINIRLLIGFLGLVSITTLFNIAIIYWIPIIIPISSLTAVRLVFLAFIEKNYCLLLFSFLICLLLFLTTVSVYRRHILLPSLSLIYLTYDLVRVFVLLINGLGDGYWKTYIIQTIVLIALIVLLCVYFLNIRRQWRQKTQGDGSPVLSPNNNH